MRYSGLPHFLSSQTEITPKSLIAVILAEDDCEITATLRHHLTAGFDCVILLATPDLHVPSETEALISRIDYNIFQENALIEALNVLNDHVEGAWIYYCFNAEFLFFPFCETRSIADMLAFHTEERRDAMLTYVIDLYANDLEQYPNAVSLSHAHLDKSGYYALARKDPAANWAERERQLDFFGGLRWRFEEHIPAKRRKIDRVSLYRAKPGLRLRPDFTLSDEEYNTYACPWHNNITATICSFRTAKALRSNPGSRHSIKSFKWHNSVPFTWHSQQLMDLGLMEPGQWF